MGIFTKKANSNTSSSKNDKIVQVNTQNNIKKHEKPQPKSLNEGHILIAGGILLDLEASERFRMLRAQLEKQIVSAPSTDVIAITSAVPSEGKSIISTNLSRAFASDPQGKTIIIDCDLRKPNVHRFFGINSTPGLSDLLVAGKSLSNTVQSVEPGLDLICAGSPVIDSTRTIESPGLKLLITELKKTYKHIILDCPPVLMCSEVLSIAELASGSILVARAWRTERQLVQEASEILNKHNLLGVVLNECSDSLSHYGYYGYYGYMGQSKAANKGAKSSSKIAKMK